MKKTIATALAATAAGVIAGFVTTGTLATADEGEAPRYYSVRECERRTDTQCVTYPQRGHHNPEGPETVRFVSEDGFCVLYRVPNGGVRCENYWPFRRPVINADLAK